MIDKKFASLIGPWTANTSITAQGDLYTVLQLSGFSSDLADISRINAAHAMLNQAAMNNGDHRTEWLQHFTRVKQARMTPLPACRGWFASRFDQAYTECLGGALYRNDLWLTIVRRPPRGLMFGLRSIFDNIRNRVAKGDLTSGVAVPYAERVFLDEFEDLATRIMGSLGSICPLRRLGLQQRAEGRWYNEADEAYHLILNNFYRQIPVTRGRSVYNIAPYEMHSGEGAWMLDTGVASRRYGCMFGFVNYPVTAPPIIFDRLRGTDFGLTLTNSMSFTRRLATMKSLSDKVKRMRAGRDAAEIDLDQVQEANRQHASGLNVWGRHQFSLAVHSETLEGLDRSAVKAESILGDAAIAAEREPAICLKAAYYTQLPGNRRWRTRPTPMSSDVVSSFMALHNVPTGRFKGRWGPPLFNLRTTADTEYPFHLHVQDSPQIPKEDLGSVLVLGPAGSGKTSLMGSFALLSERQGARAVIVDKDLGLAPMVNAAGGSYLVLPNGEPSGLSPLRALQNTPEDIDYIIKLIRMLIMSDGKGEIDSADDERIPRSVMRQMEMPPHMRSLSGVAVMLGQKDRNGARARLRKWCWGERLGWVLDCPEDRLDTTNRIMGYDTTALLTNEEVCSQVLSYIFYRTSKLINGKPIIFMVDEMWHADKNEAFGEDNNNRLKTIRKEEGVVVLGTQSAADALNSRFAHTYKQQIPTKIFFGDADASADELMGGFSLTRREFEHVKFRMQRHQFLVKRPGASFVARFDLSRRPDQIAVISGRRATYDLMNRLKAQHGSAPEQWVPHFEMLAPNLVDEPIKHGEMAA